MFNLSPNNSSCQLGQFDWCFMSKYLRPVWSVFGIITCSGSTGHCSCLSTSDQWSDRPTHSSIWKTLFGISWIDRLQIVLEYHFVRRKFWGNQATFYKSRVNRNAWIVHSAGYCPGKSSSIRRNHTSNVRSRVIFCSIKNFELEQNQGCFQKTKVKQHWPGPLPIKKSCQCIRRMI